MQIVQCRVAGAEVIQRQPHADAIELIDQIGDLCAVVDQDGLGDLEFELIRHQTGSAQRQQHTVKQMARVTELARRKIDGNAKVVIRLQFTHYPAGLDEHPLADVVDQTTLFGDRNELVCRHLAQFCVLPAEQSLDGHGPAGAQVHDWLEGEPEFLFSQG